eukprot:scpid66097/ scgid30164/ 
MNRLSTTTQEREREDFFAPTSAHPLLAGLVHCFAGRPRLCRQREFEKHARNRLPLCHRFSAALLVRTHSEIGLPLPGDFQRQVTFAGTEIYTQPPVDLREQQWLHPR